MCRMPFTQVHPLIQEGDTGLIFAVMGGHFDTVKLLIDLGAKIDIRNVVIGRLGLGLGLSNAGEWEGAQKI